MAEWLIRFLRLIEPGDSLVRVKSWRPSWDKHGIGWPMMLVDQRGRWRITTMPIWNWERVRLLIGFRERPTGPFDTGPM